MSKVKVKVYGMDGKETGEQELSADLFGVKIRPAIIHEVVMGIEAGLRRPYAHTKTRGDVRGGGKKPWKQKGTGRARHGSSRSPIWVGGGITFGPRSDRNYNLKINRKQKRLAFAMALSDKAAGGNLLVLESLAIKDGKTKEIAKLIGKLPVTGKVGLVVAGKDALASRAAHNLPKLRLNNAADLGLLDVLKAKFLVLTTDAVKRLEQAHSKK